MLNPADIRRLYPENFEFLWRTILRREHGVSYQHVDGNGIDCLTSDDATAYQIYHHQGASAEVARAKFRDDLKAATRAREEGRCKFEKWVFVSTFAFKAPAQHEWLEQQKGAAPVQVDTWGDEVLGHYLARYPDLAVIFGLADERVAKGPTPTPDSTPPSGDLLMPRYHKTQDGIVWGWHYRGFAEPFCAGCLGGAGRWVALSKRPRIAGQGTAAKPVAEDYVCPLGHPAITIPWPYFRPYISPEKWR